jgi:hypothetical protein
MGPGQLGSRHRGVDVLNDRMLSNCGREGCRCLSARLRDAKAGGA